MGRDTYLSAKPVSQSFLPPYAEKLFRLRGVLFFKITSNRFDDENVFPFMLLAD
jgi:hypothetical protein